jgi:hypothetical protein
MLEMGLRKLLLFGFEIRPRVFRLLPQLLFEARRLGSCTLQLFSLQSELCLRSRFCSRERLSSRFKLRDLCPLFVKLRVRRR